MPADTPSIPPYFAQRDGIRIRPYRLDDATPFFWAAMSSRQDIQGWMPQFSERYTLDDARTWVLSRLGAWHSGQAFEFVIERVEDGELIGSVGLSAVQQSLRYAQIGYWVRTDAHGHGIGCTAIKLAAGFAFDVLALSRIEFAIQTGNSPARASAENAGALFETVARNRLREQGQPIDAAVYALVPGDLYNQAGDLRGAPVITPLRNN